MMCKNCWKDKPEAEFAKKIGVGLAKRCAPCREKLCKYQKLSHTRVHGTMRPHDYRLKHLYGVTQAQVDAQAERQNFTCAICDLPNTGERALAIDHCHKTSKVRGLLCNYCNVGIGYFKDDPEYMLKAIAYLKDPPFKG